ncbi:MAG: galactokinase [Anaerolineae bacterium]|nr:galactokinase [Anaerolineae bacterium]
MTPMEYVIHAFQKQFNASPAYVVRAPGRVNLIGEHTDYNDGFVLPLAIDRATWIALRLRPDRQVVVHALDFGEQDVFHLDDLAPRPGSWANYVRGVAWALHQHGFAAPGWEGVMAGDVPIGAGLSSSASVEMAVARAFAAVAGWPWEAPRMALIGQYAENKWVGVNCGIMDQMISAAGVADHALLIDCRSLETTPFPLPAGVAVAVLDTATRRGLVDSAYNERRAQCEAASRHFGAKALRDVTIEQLEAARADLDPVTYRRARHVITENDRVLQACDAMRTGDATALGQLLNASHISLRDDFQVSSRELDIMVEAAQDHPGCLGARMTGAGFGGCAIALVQEAAIQAFVASVAERYETRTGLAPRIYVCRATAGAEVVTGW